MSICRNYSNQCVWWLINACTLNDRPSPTDPVLSPRSSSMGTASMGLIPSELIFFMDCEISLSFSPATNWEYTVGRNNIENPRLPSSVRATDISWEKERCKGERRGNGIRVGETPAHLINSSVGFNPKNARSRQWTRLCIFLIFSLNIIFPHCW